MRPRYREEPCTSALNRVRGMPFKWSLNPYMGCVHRCTFCFVRAFERLADRPSDDRYGTSIRVKTNLVEVLRREVTRPRWRRETVAFGTATDPYQPAEGRWRLTRGAVEVLGASSTPFDLITRGPLIVRDVDVLVEAARRASVSVTLSIPTVDRAIWRRTEPGTAPPAQRLRALRILVDHGIRTNVGMAPLLPGLSDRPDRIDDVVRAARDAGATGIWANLLYLKPGTREHFLDRLARDWPELVPAYERLYASGAYAPKARVGAARARVATARRRHGIADRRTVKAEPPTVDTDGPELPPGAYVPAPGQLTLAWTRDPPAADDASAEAHEEREHPVGIDARVDRPRVEEPLPLLPVARHVDLQEGAPELGLVG